MKLKAIIISAIALLAVTTAAQAGGGLIEFGAKAGVTTQGVKFTGVDGVDASHRLSTNSRAGFHLGLMSRINLPLIHFQPEIMFQQTGYRLEAIPAASSIDYGPKSIVRLKTVDVPVLVGLKVLWLHVQAGPMFTVMSETKLKDRSYIEDVGIDKPSVSYLLGIGLELKNLNFDIRYNGNFKKYTQSILYGEETQGKMFRSKHKYWMFSVGYMF